MEIRDNYNMPDRQTDKHDEAKCRF